MLELAYPTTDDLLYVGRHMRAADQAEIRAMSGQHPTVALLRADVTSRNVTTVLLDGEPLLIAGVSERDLVLRIGAPWLVGTDKMVAHARPLLRECRPWLDEAEREFEYLENYVDARNVEAVRWLGWLGFTIDPPERMGVARVPFHRFYKKVQNV